jgi:hypothetical protein
MSKFVHTTTDASSDPGHQAQFVNLDRVDSFLIFTANAGKWYIQLKSAITSINNATVNREFATEEDAFTGARLLVDVVNMSNVV